MSVLLCKLAARFARAPYVKKETETAKVKKFMDYMASLVCEVKKQLSYITDGDSLDYDATFHSIFPQFFTPEITYADDTRVEKELKI